MDGADDGTPGTDDGRPTTGVVADYTSNTECSRHRRGHGDSEQGAGTLLMAGLAMLALLLTATLILMVQAATGASRAATAADLAALAAADAARGITAGEPCAEAAATAEQHGAELVQCEVAGSRTGIVVVRVVIGAGGPLPDATGAARAGPPG